MRLRKMLVVVDPTAHEQPALQKALRIARHCRSSLELYICDAEQDIPDNWAGASRANEYREMMRLRRLDELNVLAKPIRAEGLQVSTVCEWHAPLEQGIAHHVIRSQPDLVVKDTRYQMPMTRSQQDRTDWTLIRQLHAPLLLIRGPNWSPVPRIAAAVDPCRPADRPVGLAEAIVNYGRAFANILAGSLDVYHVLQTPPHLVGDTVTAEQKAAAHMRARILVKSMAGRATAGTQFAEGTTAQGLEELSREFAPDVLVMGVGARSVQILERLSCDLLVTKG